MRRGSRVKELPPEEVQWAHEQPQARAVQKEEEERKAPQRSHREATQLVGAALQMAIPISTSYRLASLPTTAITQKSQTLMPVPETCAGIGEESVGRIDRT